MFVERPLASLRFFYRGAVWRIKKKKKAIYLTFDDGPIPDITPRVLDILDKYKIKATFFCVGENVKKHPEIYGEILKRGHQVGNHTYNHLRGFEYSTKNYVSNVRKASEFIDSKLFRPPYGRITPKQLNLLLREYKVVLWDLITRDYNSKLSPEYILFNIKKMTRNGSIIVFHDSIKAQKNLFAVLPQAIEYWQKERYEFRIF